MKVDINFAGMPILYKTLKKKKEIQLNFPGKTLRDLTNALIRQFGKPMKKALLDRAGDIDMEIRVILNQADYLMEDRMEKTLNEGDSLVIMGAS